MRKKSLVIIIITISCMSLFGCSSSKTQQQQSVTEKTTEKATEVITEKATEAKLVAVQTEEVFNEEKAQRMFDSYMNSGEVEREIKKKLATGGKTVRRLEIASSTLDRNKMYSYTSTHDSYGFIIKGNYSLDDEYGSFFERGNFEAIYIISRLRFTSLKEFTKIK